MNELIATITDVIAEGKIGGMLRVTAHGQTPTNGWTEIELRLSCVTEDAIEFDFVGTPPEHASGVITDISASTEHPLLPPFGPKYVTVVAATGKVTCEVEYGGKKRIRQIDDAGALLNFNEVTVTAKGMVTTTGWSEPELRLIDDGKAEFVALPPPDDAIVIPVLTPIEAEATFGPYLLPMPQTMTVVAQTNHKTVDVKPQPVKRSIDSVTFVDAAIEDGNMLVVRTKGRNNQSGWTDFELALTGESDDTLHFDFLGVPPSGAHNPVLTDTPEITFELPLMPIFPKFVRVEAATNSITRSMPSKERVLSVDRVLTRWEGNTLHVTATGSTREFNWTCGELRPIHANDAFAFELVGVAGGPDAIGTIEASVDLGPLMPIYPQTLLIVAETNSVTCRLHTAEVPQDKALIGEVTAVEAIRSATELNVRAKGKVFSSDWTGIELRSLGHFGEVAEYAFLGNRPQGVTRPIVEDVEAFDRTLLRPPFPDSVTVIASNGALTVTIAESSAATTRPSKRSAARPTA